MAERFVHVAIFNWREGVTAEQVDRAEETLRRLFANTEGLLDVRMGRDLHLRSGRFGEEMGVSVESGDFAVVMTFDERASWEAYNAVPEHRTAVREVIGRLASRRVSVQFVE